MSKLFDFSGYEDSDEMDFIDGDFEDVSEPEASQVIGLFADFGVTSEDGLLEKLSVSALTLPCLFCHHEMTLERVTFRHGDPCCRECGGR